MVPVQVCRIQVLFLNDDDFWVFVHKKKPGQKCFFNDKKKIFFFDD